MAMKYLYICLLGMLLLFVACTGKFRDFNTDLSGITDEDLIIDDNGYGIRLGIIQQGIYFNYDYGKGKNWPFQLTQNLNADMFCGYMHDAKPLNGGSHNSDYNLQDGWNSAMWTQTYSYIFPQIYQSENATRNVHSALFGITKILKVEVMHRVTDYYGPIIYKHFADAQSHYRPDTQKDVYYEFFNELDSAVCALTNYIEEKPESVEFTRFDILMDGKYTSWIKFANSLRMRLAMRLAAVDPGKARSEFLKGLENVYGVFEADAEKVAVSTKSGYTNPLGEINRVWNEAYMGAAMESILKGYDDPRLEIYFEPCTDEKNKGKFRGIRQGTCFAHSRYSGLSKLSWNQSTDAPLMTSSEVWFLRAEAALRGWTLEDEETCYHNGVENSFRQYGIYQMGDYLTIERKASDFVDAFDSDNDIKARCKVSPQWNPQDDKETKLEKIITQKWIAMFPEGCEAWAEQRRTGYPRLFPVRFNHSKNGCVDTEIMIRRLNFPGTLQTENWEQYFALVKALGADDNAGSRLWWDTGNNNLE
ncbi:SusD/RagB family nutrient-binding outer membrane lipoprotein [Bacteroides sp.]|uniref:SusD/RagB family nutrient-binding outer membrane lipoprotein n=1 Tax=Bacteroides sp. TaxID=29523 RepID=UPI00261D5BAF|nr:SusD/RagB family nutrient-binding outer membrane lipoprotein [Bacteroides sp.]MDD3036687.1 SusD/RagB family nutrient-binding outer membrane lipoprotein [Bacteroides sp.]